jgi:hypothetical protein
MGIETKNISILESAGLAFVRVTDNIFLPLDIPGHETKF